MWRKFGRRSRRERISSMIIGSGVLGLEIKHCNIHELVGVILA